MLSNCLAIRFPPPAGSNCETCAFDYYRKAGVNPSDSEPCTPCNCDEAGSTGSDCVKVVYSNSVITMFSPKIMIMQSRMLC